MMKKPFHGQLWREFFRWAFIFVGAGWSGRLRFVLFFPLTQAGICSRLAEPDPASGAFLVSSICLWLLICLFIYLMHAWTLSPVQLFVTSWIVARQAPPSMEFSRQESGVGAFPFSRGSSWPSVRSWVSCIAGNSLPSELPGKPHMYTTMCKIVVGTFCRAQGTQLGALWWPREVGWGGAVEGRSKRKGIYVYI